MNVTAMCQAVKRKTLAVEVQIRSQASPRRIWCRQNGSWSCCTPSTYPRSIQSRSFRHCSTTILLPTSYNLKN